MHNKRSFRPSRVFSEEVQRAAVIQFESCKMSVTAVCRQYGVTAPTVYRWINKYSRHLQSGHIMVVQMESEAQKNEQLLKKIAELEAALGRKQMEVDFLNKMIEIGKEELGVDLKKKLFTPPFSGSESTNENTATR